MIKETWIPVDLARFPPSKSIKANADGRDRIGAIVTRKGEPVNLTASSMLATLIMPDGTVQYIAEYGGISGNRASVTLPEEAYEIAGNVTISLRYKEGDSITTLCYVTMMVGEGV